MNRFIAALSIAVGIMIGTPSAAQVRLRAPGSEPVIVVEDSDWEGVRIAADNLAGDFARVCGTKPDGKGSGTRIIIGTIGKSGIASSLSDEEKAGLEGAHEKYLIKAVKGQPVIIAGSDKRGTTYGIYELSRMIGVSPWYWWADVPSEHRETIEIEEGSFTAGEPKVQYRGIFLNDEWPALTEWAKEQFGGYNSKFYVHVFELLLRLKANFLWPAMWDSAFYDDDPMNMVLADKMGIIMGTSHHEPCARAQKEWHRYGSGLWDYTKNKKTLDSFWAEGIKRMKDTEDIVTIGMRGDGDMPMTEGQNIRLLEKIVREQRKIIEKQTGKKAAEVPQVWALYKEVQDYYDKGMRVPDDVTLLLCDDNWGNVRKLPTEERAGGYGMYYHFDYVGGPRCYRWINTNQTARIAEQMLLSYDKGVSRLWIVNVGDLKPMEYPVQFFLDLAWDPDAYRTNESIAAHTKAFAKEQFGAEHADEIARLITDYGTMARRCTPELLSERTYSFEYDEWPWVLNQWKELELKALRLKSKMPREYVDAFEELVSLPIEAFGNLHEMYYAKAMNSRTTGSEKNHWADLTTACWNRDRELMNHYNKEIAGGRWNHMMDQPHIGYRYWQMPDQDIEPTVERDDSPQGHCFVEKEGFISIDGDSYAFEDGIRKLDDIGREGIGITGGPGATVEYSFENESEGMAEITLWLSPSLNWNDTGLRYRISIDGGEPLEVNIHEGFNNRIMERWEAESIIKSVTGFEIAPGRHEMKIELLEESIIIQKLTIDFGGMRPSRLGPPQSERKI